MRIRENVKRGEAVDIMLDGQPIAAWRGETLAAAMLAAGSGAFHLSKDGTPRGLYCNMGTCSECMVTLRAAGTERRVRSCLVDVVPGQIVETRAAHVGR